MSLCQRQPCIASVKVELTLIHHTKDKKESLISENSEFSLGNSSYLVAISTIKAHLPVTLMFHKRYDKLDIGLPTHRNRKRILSQFLLLSYGACSKSPMIGRTWPPLRQHILGAEQTERRRGARLLLTKYGEPFWDCERKFCDMNGPSKLVSYISQITTRSHHSGAQSCPGRMIHCAALKTYPCRDCVAGVLPRIILGTSPTEFFASLQGDERRLGSFRQHAEYWPSVDEVAVQVSRMVEEINSTSPKIRPHAGEDRERQPLISAITVWKDQEGCRYFSWNKKVKSRDQKLRWRCLNGHCRYSRGLKRSLDDEIGLQAAVQRAARARLRKARKRWTALSQVRLIQRNPIDLVSINFSHCACSSAVLLGL